MIAVATVATALIAKQMKTMGLNIPWTGTYGMLSPANIQAAGEAFDGVIVATPKVYVVQQFPDSAPQKKVALQFMDAYKKTAKVDIVIVDVGPEREFDELEKVLYPKQSSKVNFEIMRDAAREPVKLRKGTGKILQLFGGITPHGLQMRRRYRRNVYRPGGRRDPYPRDQHLQEPVYAT